MYVIFPAEELIYMTYGAAVPRIKPRPTLDNLREPLVPIGVRPSPSKTVGPNTTITTTTTISNQSLPVTNTYEFKENTINNTFSNTYCNSNNNNNYNCSNNNISNRTLKSDNSITYNQNSLYEPTLFSDIEGTNQHQISIESYDCMTDFTQDRYMRDRSPSIFLEPPSPTEGPPISSRSISPTQSTSQQAAYSPKSPTPSKSKIKPKLTLSLGRLGRQQPDQTTESIRLREDLELHVANPTFTRENLRQRNYDAFFESGEPVYSLEPKIAISPESSIALETNSPLSSNQLLSATTTIGNESSKIRSLNLFRRSKSPVAWRSKSADLESSREAEVYQKGDRCHRISFLYCSAIECNGFYFVLLKKKTIIYD